MGMGEPLEQPLYVSKADDVANLVINRPRKKNSVTEAMWERIPELVGAIDADPEVKVLVIRGSTPDAFCAGADINEYRDRVGDPEWGNRSRLRVSEALVALREMAKPSISAIRGACFGGGVAIALATDFRMADTTAYFSVSPARMGMVYTFPGTVELVRTVGAATAKRLLYTGDVFGAEEAARIGLVDPLVAPEQLDGEVDDLCARIIAASQFSVRATKRIVHLIEDGLAEENDEAAQLVLDALEGEDHLEGVTAFFERRRPEFRFR